LAEANTGTLVPMAMFPCSLLLAFCAADTRQTKAHAKHSTLISSRASLLDREVSAILSLECTGTHVADILSGLVTDREGSVTDVKGVVIGYL